MKNYKKLNFNISLIQKIKEVTKRIVKIDKLARFHKSSFHSFQRKHLQLIQINWITNIKMISGHIESISHNYFSPENFKEQISHQTDRP